MSKTPLVLQVICPNPDCHNVIYVEAGKVKYCNVCGTCTNERGEDVFTLAEWNGEEDTPEEE